MKLIIAGTRTVTDPLVLSTAMDLLPEGMIISQIIQGGARGVEALAVEWAYQAGVQLVTFHSDLGPIRNRAMAEYGDRLLAIWDGKSRGTQNMIEEMDRLKKPVQIHRL